MTEEKIEVSGSGFKFSYLRFLADGAAGLLMILLFTAAYYKNAPIALEVFGAGRGLRDVMHVDIGREAKIFILLVALALAIPLGLALNALGWFLLGWLKSWGMKFLMAHTKNFMVRPTTEIFNLTKLQPQFGLDDQTCFYEKSHFYEEVIETFHPSGTIRMNPIRGIGRLLRSMAVIFSLGGIYVLLVGLKPWQPMYLWLSLGVLLAGFCCLALMILLEFYEKLGVLFKAYVLALDHWKEIAGMGSAEQEIFASLVQRGLPRVASGKEEA